MKKSARRRWAVQPWPWPGDSREDKAKRIALSYRQLVEDIINGGIQAPATALARIDQRWATHGHYWPNPPDELIDDLAFDDWHTAADLAHLLHCTPADIYRWARRGNIEQRVSADGCPEYSLASARRYLAAKRQRRTRSTSRNRAGNVVPQA